MWEMNHRIHELYAPDLRDDRLARQALARDLRTIGRARLGLGEIEPARQAYRASLGKALHPAGLGWTLLLSAPGTAAPLRRLAERRRGRAAATR